MSLSTPCCDPLLPGLDEPSSLRLANGAELISLPMADAPLVCLDFWCRAGSVEEREGERGMAHFLEHMVFKGSQTLSAGEFDRRVEALGGSTNAATGFDDVHYHVLIPSAGAAEALDLLLDLVLRPRLEAEAFGMERQVVLEEIAQSEDQPEEVALQKLLSLACPDHPYGRPILGTSASLLEQGPEAMAGFHRRLYGAERCVLALAGDVGSGELIDKAARSALAGLVPSELPAPSPLPPLTAGLHRLAVPRLEAARLLMAWWQPPAADLDAVMGADLATTLLAEGRRSRLVEHLRERLRIVESIDLDLHAMECGSIALLEAVCEPGDLPRVREQIGQVWRELMQEPVGEEEWRRACRLVANGYRFALEAPAGVAGLIGSNRLWARPAALDLPLVLLDDWTPERLRDQALSGLDPRQACVLEAVPA